MGGWVIKHTHRHTKMVRSTCGVCRLGVCSVEESHDTVYAS